ncbi:SIMPL domain-containing protein [Halovulum dunhuangense]|uniref:SIMPL domain-containing protein n=1 Tax=Halovulum dunhuangense TaxID=1505036 RepID=A0A849L110_9RHOB|nr:SIMPL domain-containing protein [Halovulum dunhuangense]NNU79966.1 SIMPL domain-containing protein [Halovulum dunhuangense]
MLRSIGILVVCAALAAPAWADDEPGRIAVSGEGRVESAPDMAVVTAGVETTAASAGEALAANSAAMTAVMEVLTAAGVESRDVQTTEIGLNPVWTGPQPGREEEGMRISGYSATNLVTINVRALDGLGGVLDALGQAGVNRIQGIAFSVAEPRALEDEARRAAVADARARAELYAQAAGVELGPLMELRDSFAARPPMMLRAEVASMDAGVPVSGGSVALTAQVEMVFAIAD